ncbi:MAG: glycosyltransferase family 2 protein, partial [Planctomycetota bacterium]
LSGDAPRVSLCMIAKNEEAFLAECLASVRGIVDEAIVVDTGSTDRTVRIAEDAGARVLRFDWCDDFARARNVGVDAASGTHVLILDADERLAPRMGPNLLDAARDPELLLGCLPLYNAASMDATADELLSGEKCLGDQVFVPRLFRRLPEMRFERRVHETLTNGFNVLQARGEGLSKAVGAALLHYGDVPTFRTGMRKDDRNERLLRMSLEDDPTDGEVAGYLVVQLLRGSRADEARAVGERHFAPFVARNEARPAGHLPENMVRIGYALGLVQAEQGAAAEALHTVRVAQRFTPDGHPNLVYVEGLAHLGLGDLDAGERTFRAVRTLEGRRYAQPVLEHITNELPCLKLAGIQLARGDADAARRELPTAEGPWAFATKLMEAEIEIEAGRPADAMEILAPFVDLDGLAPDWHVLVHRALSALGKDPEGLVELATSARRSAWLEPRRRPVGVG